VAEVSQLSGIQSPGKLVGLTEHISIVHLLDRFKTLQIATKIGQGAANYYAQIEHRIHHLKGSMYR
jgi:hypothetical protein